MKTTDPKNAAIIASVKSLVELQKSIKTDTIDSAEVLSNKFNSVAESLQQIHRAGRNMDHSSMLEIPVELLLFLEGGDVSNPDLYQQRSMDNHEKLANQLSDRLTYLHGIRGDVNSLGLEDRSQVVVKDEKK